MMKEFAFLIVITSAWSGQAMNINEMPDMTICRQALSDLKVAASSGNAAAAYCAPRAPDWWFNLDTGKSFLARNPEYKR